MSEVLTLDVVGQPPLVPGEFFVSMEQERAGADILDMRFHSAGRAGRRLSARLSEDLWLFINDNLWSEATPHEAVFRGSGIYAVSLRLSGESVESVNEHTYSLGPFSCSMVQYAPGVRHVFRLLPQEPLMEVCVSFSTRLMMEKYGLGGEEVEELFNPPAHRRLDRWFNQCRMSARIESVVQDLRSVTPAAQARRLFWEAKALELIALYLERLQSQATELKRTSLRPSELQRLHQARQYLGRHYAQPIRIESLCRLFALNRRKLSEGFKSEFGRTVHEYVQSLRMEQAKAMLAAGLNDIQQIAKRVGYTHQGNFTRAFKRYTGRAPSQCVRGLSKLNN